MSDQTESSREKPLYLNYSPEEQALLRSCKNEALTQRALPCATLFGVSTYYALKKGFIKPTENFGFWGRVIVGGTLGKYFDSISTSNDK